MNLQDLQTGRVTSLDRQITCQEARLQREADSIRVQVWSRKSKAANQVASSLRWKGIQNLACQNAGSEIWEFFVSSRGLYVFVVTPKADCPEVYFHPDLSEVALREAMEQKWFGPYRRLKEARQRYVQANDKTPLLTRHSKPSGHFGMRMVPRPSMDEVLGWLGKKPC